jgi:hypothetical protein
LSPEHPTRPDYARVGETADAKFNIAGFSQDKEKKLSDVVNLYVRVLMLPEPTSKMPWKRRLRAKGT